MWKDEQNELNNREKHLLPPNYTPLILVSSQHTAKEPSTQMQPYGGI